MSNTFDAKNVALQASKHLIRRYLDPKNIPKTPSDQVFGRLGLTNKRCCWGFPRSLPCYHRYLRQAKNMGCVVRAFDVRPATREQVVAAGGAH